MRRKMILADRVCEQCGKTYTPTGSTQRYCRECAKMRHRVQDFEYRKRKNPSLKPKEKSKEVCCICGEPFSSHYNGKPYCNKHYLRMYFSGTPELRGRASTNTFEVVGDVMKITTKSGIQILADAEDTPKITSHSWCISRTGYAVANIDHRTVKMHHLVFGDPPAGYVTDHINGNPLDNRKSNLRFCTPKENARNCKVGKNNKTGFTGVKKADGKYKASIMVDRKSICLGTYEKLEDAVKVRKEAEKEYFGEFARNA